MLRSCRSACLVLALAACGPRLPGETAGEAQTTGVPDTTTASPSEPTTTTPVTTNPTSDTAEPTSSGSSATAAETTSTSMDSSTGELETCAWEFPEFKGLRFCPDPSGVGTAVSGTTPFGPASFQFALFGLQGCASCPDPTAPSIALYSAAPGPDVEHPSVDFVRFSLWFEVGDAWAQIAGTLKDIDHDDVTVELMVVPSVDETSPPLDEAMPPILSGTVAIQGGGWDLAGSFTATLCNDLDWSVACE